MAKQVKLSATRRTGTGRSAVRKIKAQGAVPAIIYGGKNKPEPLQVSKRDISLLLSRASGENILVELEIDGEKAGRLALMQEVQHAPLGGDILHVDFHAVSMDEMIEADVPLESTGIAEGVKTFGGLLEQNLRSLEIECLPRDLPDVITVDVSHLNIGDSIHVRPSAPSGRDDARAGRFDRVLGPRADGGRRASRRRGSSYCAGSDYGEEGST